MADLARSRTAARVFAVLSVTGLGSLAACGKDSIITTLPLSGPFVAYFELTAQGTVRSETLSTDLDAPMRFDLANSGSVVFAWWPDSSPLPSSSDFVPGQPPTLTNRRPCTPASGIIADTRVIPLSSAPSVVEIELDAPTVAIPRAADALPFLAERWLNFSLQTERCGALADETLEPFGADYAQIPAGTRLANGVVGTSSDAVELEIELTRVEPLTEDLVLALSFGAVFLFERGRTFVPDADHYLPTRSPRILIDHFFTDLERVPTRSSSTASFLASASIGTASSAVRRYDVDLVNRRLRYVSTTSISGRHIEELALSPQGDLFVGTTTGLHVLRRGQTQLEPLAFDQSLVVKTIAFTPRPDAPHLVVSYTGVVFLGNAFEGRWAEQNLQIGAETGVDAGRLRTLETPDGFAALIGAGQGRAYYLTPGATSFRRLEPDLPIDYVGCGFRKGACNQLEYGDDLMVIELLPRPDGRVDRAFIADFSCTGATTLLLDGSCGRVHPVRGRRLVRDRGTRWVSSRYTDGRVLLGGRLGRLAELRLTPR